MNNKKPIDRKTQAEVRRETIQPLDMTRVPSVDDKRTKRAENRRIEESDPKTLSIGLKDIDEAIFYYFNNVIRPSVVQNGTKINVPLIYGSQERWAAVQRDGYYRSKEGKIMTPLIMIKRDSIEKNRTLGNKLDANNPNNVQVFEKKFSKKNVYDRFSVLTNRVPLKEYYAVVIPDYVNITYSCIIFTDYVEQMNKIVESINYASDSYWGDPEKFKFRAMIDNYTTAVELTKGTDRAVKTNFTINLLGHIIPDTINTQSLSNRKLFSKSRVTFSLETVSNTDVLNSRSITPERESVRPFYSTPNIVDETLDQSEILFLSTSNFAIASSIVTNSATFNNRTILTPPPGFVIDQDSFNVFVNGVSMQPSHILVQQIGSNIVVTFNPSLIGYEVTSSDEVILTGKFS